MARESEIQAKVETHVEHPLKKGAPAESSGEKAIRAGKLIERIFREERRAKVHFARAQSSDPRERRQFRIEISKTKQQSLDLAQAQQRLKDAWTAAGLKPPTEIINNPADIQHSAVAAEMVARITALPPELQKNPQIIYRKVAEAYTSIDWRSLTHDQEVELQTVLDNTFNHMRQVAKEQGLTNVPEDNEQLWRGLNDYYFSAHIPDQETVPPEGQSGHNEALRRNEQRSRLRTRLTELQRTLSQEPPDQAMKKYLNDAWKDLNEGYTVETTRDRRTVRVRRAYMREDVEPTMGRLRDEANQWERGGGGAGRAATTEEIPSAVQYEDWIKDLASQTGGKGLLDDAIEPGILDAVFPKPEHAALKARLGEVQKWLRFEGPDGIGATGIHSFESAKQVIRTMLNDRSLEPKQIRFLQEDLLNPIEAQMMKIRQENQPMSRFYLTAAERAGLDRAPIETIDHMFDSLIDQIIRDPEGPRARAAMERLQLMQEYLFSDEFDINKLKGITAENLVQLEKVRHEFRQRSAKQRESFGRSFTIRLHAAQFIEQWSNADSPSNPEFQRFLNSRMNEDDFFGLDGLYGNLVARAREKIRTNYEALLFDNNSIKQGYDTDLWDKAVKQTLEEMNANKDYEQIYNDDYLSGKLFKERPLNEEEKIELGPTIIKEPSVELTDKEKLLPEEQRKKIETEKIRAAEEWKQLEADRRKHRYEDACPTIVSLANIRMIMSAEKYNLDVRFRPIHWSVASGQTPSTFLEKAKIAKLMRPWEFHMQTWGSFSARPAFEKAQLRHRAGIMVEACPQIKKWANDLTENLWTRITRYKQGEMTEAAEIKALCGDLDTYFFFTPKEEDRPMFIYKDTQGDMKKAKDKLAVWLGGQDSYRDTHTARITKDKLNKEMQIYAGLLIDQQHTMRPYTVMFESGYRRDADTGFLTELNEEVRGTFGEKGVFVGGEVVGAANDYFMKMYTGQPEAFDFVRAMAEASTYRPHSMALALKEGGSAEFDKWLVDNFGGKGKFTGEKGIYRELSLKFDEIRSGLLIDKVDQIDYSRGIDGLIGNEKQRTLVKKAFGLGPEDEPNEAMKDYFGKMQKLSVLLRGEEIETIDKKKHEVKTWTGLVNEFADIRYAPLLTKARWDDYPYEFMQYPERMVLASDEIPLKVSDKFKGRQAGEEQSGPWRRMWRDLGAAQTVFEQCGPMFDPDPKIRLKAIQTAYQIENGYQGPTHAAINYLMASGGRLGSEKARPRYDPFLVGLPGSSDAWEYYSGDFKGKTVDELHLELDEDMKVSSGKIVNAPDAAGIHEAIESYLGITKWRQILLGGYDSTRAKWVEKMVGGKAKMKAVEDFLEKLNDRFPSGIQKLRLTVILPWAAVALVVAAIAQAQEQVKEETRHS